jgi:hypothetical protein
VPCDAVLPVLKKRRCSTKAYHKRTIPPPMVPAKKKKLAKKSITLRDVVTHAAYGTAVIAGDCRIRRDIRKNPISRVW